MYGLHFNAQKVKEQDLKKKFKKIIYGGSQFFHTHPPEMSATPRLLLLALVTSLGLRAWWREILPLITLF